MKYLNTILHELGISKVKLAKYLGVSRQMVYNYLTLPSSDDWPKEKKVLLLQLLDVKDLTDEALQKIVVNTEYLMQVEGRLNIAIKNASDIENYFDVTGLNKDSKNTLIDITNVIKELLLNDKNERNMTTIKYLHSLLQIIDTVPEARYFLAYLSKVNGYTNPEQFDFNTDKQMTFESILFQALTLYQTGGASKSKLLQVHKKFIKEVENKKEERLSKTQQFFAIQDQALKELGISELNNENRMDFIEKLAEIETRTKLMGDNK